VFPSRNGRIETHNNMVICGLWPAQIAAGVTAAVLDDDGNPKLGNDGKPMVKAKYTGLHALRHFYASWRASIKMTLDVYGRLFPKRDARAEMEAAERAFLQAT
jgi:hypothetical protein